MVSMLMSMTAAIIWFGAWHSCFHLKETLIHYLTVCDLDFGFFSWCWKSGALAMKWIRLWIGGSDLILLANVFVLVGYCCGRAGANTSHPARSGTQLLCFLLWDLEFSWQSLQSCKAGELFLRFCFHSILCFWLYLFIISWGLCVWCSGSSLINWMIICLGFSHTSQMFAS